MQLGRNLHQLWRHRLAFAFTLSVALLAALWSVAQVSLFPPRVTARPLDVSTASTRALVDSPRSAVLDLGVDTTDLTSITSRSLLISNVMASAPVREYIARRAGVPAEVIQMTSPVTPDWPRPLRQPGQSRGTSDILKTPGQYRISLQNNPTVPMIDVYALAPTRKAAARLANGAIKGTQDYLRALAANQGVSPNHQVRLQQLGAATSGTINAGANLKLAILSFLVVFAACGAASLFVTRVVRGWRETQMDRPHAAAGASRS
jgi:hypothetical protein